MCGEIHFILCILLILLYIIKLSFFYKNTINHGCVHMKRKIVEFNFFRNNRDNNNCVTNK